MEIKRIIGTMMLIGISLFSWSTDNSILKYREKTRKKVQLHTYTVTNSEEGYSVQLKREGGTINSRETVRTDRQYSSLYWQYSDSDMSEFVARRAGNVIHIQGQFRGNPISKTINIDSSPWKQLFSIDFESFIRSSGDKHTFWSIGTSGPGEMKAAKFSVRNFGRKYISFQGETINCLQLRISLAGARSVLWKGDYWFRTTDGRYLRYRGNSGPFTAITVKELISEERSE